MSKLSKVKTMLQKMLEQFSQLSTDRGIITWSGDEELPVVGDDVQILDEDGNAVKAEDGEYKNELVSILIADGKVVAVNNIVVENPEEEPQPEENPVEEQPQEEPIVEPEPVEEPKEDEEPQPEEQPIEEPTEDPVEEQPTEEPVEEPVEDDKDALIAQQAAEIESLRARIAELEEKIKSLEKMSAANPAEEQFRSVNKIEKTGNKKLDRLIDIVNAKEV